MDCYGLLVSILSDQSRHNVRNPLCDTVVVETIFISQTFLLYLIPQLKKKMVESSMLLTAPWQRKIENELSPPTPTPTPIPTHKCDLKLNFIVANRISATELP